MSEDAKPLVWSSCPFCGGGGVVLEGYFSTGTHLNCESCAGIFVFPAFPNEVEAMWGRTRRGESHWEDTES